jgi:TolB-like protein
MQFTKKGYHKFTGLTEKIRLLSSLIWMLAGLANREGAMLLFFMILTFLLGCSDTSKTAKIDYQRDQRALQIAVLPVENLSGTAAPLREIRGALIEGLKARGIDLLQEDALEKFMAKHRVRYTGGIDTITAKQFKDEINCPGVLITSLELYNETNPPKIALTSRLVSTGDNPVILWVDGAGLAGDDSPGILGLGLIQDPVALEKKALNHVLDSLQRSLSGQKESEKPDTKGKFRPKIAFRSPVMEGKRKYAVAVVPFFNKSERKYGAEIMALHFVRHLKEFEDFEVIEPGIVRQQFLNLRIIMDQGVSLADAQAIFSVLNVDLVVTGQVLDYQDYQGSSGKPKVDFTAEVIERKSREVVWSSASYNQGDDGVFFFDWGRVNTAYAMATQMVRQIGKMMAK